MKTKIIPKQKFILYYRLKTCKDNINLSAFCWTTSDNIFYFLHFQDSRWSIISTFCLKLHKEMADCQWWERPDAPGPCQPAVFCCSCHSTTHALLLSAAPESCQNHTTTQCHSRVIAQSKICDIPCDGTFAYNWNPYTAHECTFDVCRSWVSYVTLS